MTKPHTVGLVFAIVLASWHFVWVVLVATGFGRTLYDFVLWMHMIRVPIEIGPFNSHAAITLVFASAIVGYAIGFAISLVWNRLHQ